ncbi:1647_t:CDS:2 [Funneliformis geosporum]|nr:1647_t:CDS:2 [Funneliformis geosporum]
MNISSENLPIYQIILVDITLTFTFIIITKIDIQFNYMRGDQ